MTLADLERALKAELDPGRIGVPVALRIVASFPAADDLLKLLGCFRPLISLIGDTSRGDVHATWHPSGRECTILWTAETGGTAFLTLATAPKAMPSISLLLLGNHGMAQLQGGADFRDSRSDDFPALWPKEIQESLRKGTSIRVNAS